MCNGFFGVLYRDLTLFSKKARKQILASSLSPLLYLIAFGWGLKDVEVNALPYMTFLVPGLITMASLNQSFGINGEINISRFYFHTFDEYLIAPVSRTQVALGEISYGIIRGCIATMIVFFYSILFRVSLSFHVLFLAALFLHTFLFAALGLTLALLIQDHSSQQSLNNFVITPMIFLCGTFFPVDRLPVVFKMLVDLLPLTYSTRIIRATLTGAPINPVHFTYLGFFAIFFFLAALWALRRVEG